MLSSLFYSRNPAAEMDESRISFRNPKITSLLFSYCFYGLKNERSRVPTLDLMLLEAHAIEPQREFSERGFSELVAQGLEQHQTG